MLFYITLNIAIPINIVQFVNYLQILIFFVYKTTREKYLKKQLI